MRVGFARAESLAIILVWVLAPHVSHAQGAAVLDKIGEVGPAISRCWRQPPDSVGSEVTVAFTFNRKGEVFGKPRITHSKLVGGADAQRDFLASALKAIATCTPLKFSDGLGGAVAGRPFAMRFVGRPPDVPQQKI